MNYKFKPKTQSVLFLLTGASLFLSFTEITGIARVQNQSVLAQTTKKYPLPLNDPAAILDPNLLNVPPILPPAQNRTLNVPSSQPLNVEVGYNARTRSTKVGARTQLLPQSQSPTNSSPSYRGTDTNINLEPRVNGSNLVEFTVIITATAMFLLFTLTEVEARHTISVFGLNLKI